MVLSSVLVFLLHYSFRLAFQSAELVVSHLNLVPYSDLTNITKLCSYFQMTGTGVIKE